MSSSKPSADRCHDLYELSKKLPKKGDKATDEVLFEKEKEQYTFAPNIEKEKVEGQADIKAALIPETIERLKKGRDERERVKKGLERDVENSAMRFDVESSKFKKNPEGKGTDSKSISSMHSSIASKSQKSSIVKEKKYSKKKETEAVPKEIPSSNPPVEGPVELPSSPAQPEGVDAPQEMLYIDINLGESSERIVVHQGDTASVLAEEFAQKHSMIRSIKIE